MNAYNIKSKNIVFIAYHYPPQINGGTPRIIQFKKYLEKLGYKITVFTTDKFGTLNDESMIYVDKLAGIVSNHDCLKFICRNLSRLIYNLGLTITTKHLWVNNVLKRFAFLNELKVIDIVYASYPINENLKIGLVISDKYNIPLVSEFRDGFNIYTFVNEGFF